MNEKRGDREQHMLPHLYEVTPGQWMVTGIAVGVSGIADIAMHFNGTGVIVGGILAGVVASQSDVLLDMIVPGRDAARTIEATEQVISTVMPVREEYEDQSAPAKLKRLFGLKSAPTDRRIVPDQVDEEELMEKEMEREKVQPQPRRHARKWVDLAPNLQIDPNDLAGKAIFICGIRRHGKTTLGVRIAEQMGKYHFLPMFIPDLEGDYLSLADVLPRAVIAGHSSADSTYQEYEFVALDTPEAAFQFGSDLLTAGYQVILDMQSYTELDAAVMIQVNIIRGMFQWANEHPSERVPAYVYLDEAQRFLPQQLNDSVIKNRKLVQALLNAYMDVIAIGGKRGINPVILTQRFAQVNNKIMAQSEVFFLLRQTHDGDLDRCMEYASAPITKNQIAQFKPGQGVYIAYDGTQTVAQFRQRESSGKRSTTPQADAAQRYATMSMQRPIAAPHLPMTPSAPPARPTPTAQEPAAYAAIRNMQAAHFTDADIMALMGMNEQQYQRVLAQMQHVPSHQLPDPNETGRDGLIERRDRQLWASRTPAKSGREADESQYGSDMGSSSGVPTNGEETDSELNLSDRGVRRDSRQSLPEKSVNEPVESAGCIPDAFQPGEDDLLLSGVQPDLFLLFYSNPESASSGNIAKSLEQIKNDKGQGLGKRYSRHASYLLEQRGLKKTKKA